jgi:hypothetical protein
MREFVADRLLWASTCLYLGSVWCKNAALDLLARRRRTGAR